MRQNDQHTDSGDPCLTLPTSFRTTEKVANIAEKAVPNAEEPTDTTEDRVIYEGPQRVLRTAISSIVNAGVKVQRASGRNRRRESAALMTLAR
jgi:hypothetical protein